ncbi:MAG: hypothetical protein IJ125_06945 [Atopobiaceae bacterium]|nr:hypothetical protein [Atopobiaceae bacterium]
MTRKHNQSTKTKAQALSYRNVARVFLLAIICLDIVGFTLFSHAVSPALAASRAAAASKNSAEAQTTEEEPIPFNEPKGLLGHFADSFLENTVCVGDFSFHYYTQLRIEELDPASLTNTEPIRFGPWTALEDYHAVSAREDGSLSEWETGYYITHDWSAYGQDILSMLPGDSLNINGRDAQVERIFNYPKASYYEELVEICGDNGVILQTCLPNRDMNRIVYAR